MSWVPSELQTTASVLPESPEAAARLEGGKRMATVALAFFGMGFVAVVVGVVAGNVSSAGFAWPIGAAGFLVAAVSVGFAIGGVRIYTDCAVTATRAAAPRLARLVAAKESLNRRPPQMHLELVVPHASGSAYRVMMQAQCNVARERIVRAGSELYVRVNPADPYRLEVAWEESAAHHGLPYEVLGG